MELLQHYKSFIESDTQNFVDERGHVMRHAADGPKPIMKDGKEVVLPTPEFLKNPDWNRYMPFHPMCESIARGESEILQLAQSLVRVSLWDKTIDVAQALLRVASDPNLQTKLTPSQQKLLQPISDADAVTQENFGKIIARSRHDYSDGIDRRIIAIFLKRGGSQDGQHYSRMFVVRFPMYNELCKAEEAKDAKERKVFDVALRVKDIQVLKALHEVIFPGDEGAYTIGTNSNLAPYYTVLLNGYANMARQLNTIIKPLSKTIKDLKPIDLSWDEGDLTIFRNALPPLPHNEGSDPTAEPAAPTPPQPVMASPAPAPTYPSAQPQPQQMAPAPYAQPHAAPTQPATQAPTIGTADPKHSANKVSWNEATRNNPQQQMMPYGPQGMPMYPAQPGYPMQQGYPAQPPMPGYPMQPQMPMMQPQMGFQPIMANGQPQPPMPPVSQPVQPQGQMQYLPQPQMQQGYGMPMQQPMYPMQQMPMMQPGMPMQQGYPMQPGMQPGMQFSFVR